MNQKIKTISTLGIVLSLLLGFFSITSYASSSTARSDDSFVEAISSLLTASGYYAKEDLLFYISLAVCITCFVLCLIFAYLNEKNNSAAKANDIPDVSSKVEK